MGVRAGTSGRAVGTQPCMSVCMSVYGGRGASVEYNGIPSIMVLFSSSGWLVLVLVVVMVTVVVDVVMVCVCY